MFLQDGSTHRNDTDLPVTIEDHVESPYLITGVSMISKQHTRLLARSRSWPRTYETYVSDVKTRIYGLSTHTEDV
jgi:hypothetical protein